MAWSLSSSTNSLSLIPSAILDVVTGSSVTSSIPHTNSPCQKKGHAIFFYVCVHFTHKKSFAEYSSILETVTVLHASNSLMFQKHISPSGCHDLIKQHGTMSQRTWIFSRKAVTTINLATTLMYTYQFKFTWHKLYGSWSSVNRSSILKTGQHIPPICQ